MHKLAGAALIANLASGIRMHSRLVGNIIAPTWAEYGLTIWPQKNPSPARRTSMAPNMPEVAGESSAGRFAWGTSEVSVVQTFSGSPGHQTSRIGWGIASAGAHVHHCVGMSLGCSVIRVLFLVRGARPMPPPMFPSWASLCSSYAVWPILASSWLHLGRILAS